MILIQNAQVYGPEPLGLCEILIEGTKIADIAAEGEGRSLQAYAGLETVKVLDLKGRVLTPGYIDNHVHITGGGGEGGFATRTPEASITQLLRSGVTTAVGLLGTDTVTRSLENLLAKTRALEAEGLSCYCLTGGYGCPPVTLCGSVERDVTLIDKMIGVKTAMSDHRSSNPSAQDLVALAVQARRAGLMAGCAGIVTIHTGGGKAMLTPLLQAVEQSDVPITKFLPTHMGRSDALFDQGLEFIRRGGTIDVTAGGDMKEQQALAEKILRYWRSDPAGNHLCVSSDAYGSQPKFGAQMQLIGLTYSTPAGLHQLLRHLVLERDVPLERALKLFTQTPARVLELPKGRIAQGLDADLLVLDDQLKIDGVIAKGRMAIWDGKQMIKGSFEAESAEETRL